MDERLRFVARLLDGEKMAVLCREFDISRKTGYKIFNRYKDCGLEGLTDRSRRPYRQANQLPFQIESLIVQLKREHPTWGAPKIRDRLKRRQLDIQTPAISTVHAVLDRHGLLIEPGTPPGEYRIIAGLYNAASGKRLPAPAGDFVEALPIAQPTVSKHLSVLREAGVTDFAPYLVTPGSEPMLDLYIEA